MYSRTCLIHWRAYLFQNIRCCSAEWINFHHRSPFIVTNLTYQSSLQRCWNSYKTNDKVVQQHPTNTNLDNMTINPMHHIVLISSRERTLQPTTIPTYHRHIIDASHRGTQQYNHPPVLASSFIEVYTYFIIPTALLDQWKLLGVLSTCHSWMAWEACW